MKRALARAGDMPWRRIADVRAAGEFASMLIVRKPFRRTLDGLSGFGAVWVLTVDEHGAVHAAVACLDDVDESAATLTVRMPISALDAAVVDIKPYLAYCDAWPETSDETTVIGEEEPSTVDKTETSVTQTATESDARNAQATS